MFIFCEGALRPAGEVKEVEDGVAFLAERAGVPIYPLALRTAVRGAQHPEAFVVLGERLEPRADRATLKREVKDRLNALLGEVDQMLQSADPEAPPPNFEAWLKGPQSFHERVGWVARLWRK